MFILETDPVMPGCLGLDAMWQLLGFFCVGQKLPGYGRALGADKVKFFGQVTPNSKIVKYEIDIKRVVNKEQLSASPMVRCMLMMTCLLCTELESWFI